MLKTALFVGGLFLTVKGSNTNNNNPCCCCHVDDYNEMSRSWKNETDCREPFHCCQIPTKEECEVQLNPTYDGSCGHMNEGKNQKDNQGPSAQIIYRNGENGEMKGWLGQRLYDVNSNVIEEWCIDNGRKDSFFLWRFVHCNGDYPNWFARCVFPSATNTLLYKGCNDNEFEHTIPSCFGELEEMNIGLGSDRGHDVDYRYDVEEESLDIWCTNYTMPRDPTSNIQYSGKAPGQDDGVVPFYLSQCRAAYPTITNNENRLLRGYTTLSNKNHHNNLQNEHHKNAMLPLTFRMNVMLKKLNHNFVEIIITGNNMPMGYESVIQYNDTISFNLLNKQNSISSLYLNSVADKDWIYNLNNKKQFVTFTYINKAKKIILHHNNNVSLFIVELNGDKNVDIKNMHIGWIARSGHKNGSFVGFGKLVL